VEMHRDIHARHQIYNLMEILAIYLRETRGLYHKDQGLMIFNRHQVATGTGAIISKLIFSTNNKRNKLLFLFFPIIYLTFLDFKI